MGMFVALIDISLTRGTEDEFVRYIKETNVILSKIDGFISRRLLRSHDGSYRILVEHESQKHFKQCTKIQNTIKFEQSCLNS